MSGKQTMLRVSFATSQWLKLTPLRRSRTAGLGYPIWPAVNKLSGRKLQSPLNLPEARLFAQGVQEWIGLQLP